MEGDLFGGILAGLVDHPYVFAVILLLALVNWNAEAQKFKMLIAGEVHLTNTRAFHPSTYRGIHWPRSTAQRNSSY